MNELDSLRKKNMFLQKENDSLKRELEQNKEALDKVRAKARAKVEEALKMLRGRLNNEL